MFRCQARPLAPCGASTCPPDVCKRSSSSEARPGVCLPDSSPILRLGDFTIGFCDFVTGLKSRCWMPVFANLAARGGATSRRKARGDSLDPQRSLQLHKILIHNVSNNPGAIRSAHDRFGTFYFFWYPLLTPLAKPIRTGSE